MKRQNTSAAAVMTRAARAKIPIVEVLQIINDTRCASLDADWREACDCVEDIVLMWAAKRLER